MGVGCGAEPRGGVFGQRVNGTLRAWKRYGKDFVVTTCGGHRPILGPRSRSHLTYARREWNHRRPGALDNIVRSPD